MEAKLNYSTEEIARMEIRNFVNEGLQDATNNNLVNFDELFDELETRYRANE